MEIIASVDTYHLLNWAKSFITIAMWVDFGKLKNVTQEQQGLFHAFIASAQQMLSLLTLLQTFIY